MLKRLIRRNSAKEVETVPAEPASAPTPQQPKLRVDLSKQKSTGVKPVKTEEVVVVEHPRFVGPTPPHILAYEGRYEELKAAIEENPYVAYDTYDYNGNIPLLTPQEEDDELFMPPPLIPKNVRAALAVGDVRRMTRDERWVLAKGFGKSSLLHYACAGNRLQIVKYLIEMVGIDRHMMNINQKPAEYFSDSDAILEYIWSRDRLEQLSSSRSDANRAKTKSGRILKPRASEYLEKLRATLENANLEHHNSDDNNSHSSSGMVYKSKIPFQQSFTKRPFANVPEDDDSIADSQRSSITGTNSRRLSKRRLSRVLSTRRMQENELNNSASQEPPEEENQPSLSVISSARTRAPPPPSRPEHLLSPQQPPPPRDEDESLLDELEAPSVISEKDQADIIASMSRPPLVMRRLSARSDTSDVQTEDHHHQHHPHKQHSANERRSINRSSIKRSPPPPPPPHSATAQHTSPPPPPSSVSTNSIPHTATPPPPPPPSMTANTSHPSGSPNPLPPPPPAAGPPAPPSAIAAPKPPPLSHHSTINFEQKESSNPSIQATSFTERRTTYRSNKDLIDDEFETALQLAYADAKARNDRIVSETQHHTTRHVQQLVRAADILKRFRPIEQLANTLLSENAESQEHVYRRAQRNLRLLQQQQQQARNMRPMAIPGVFVNDTRSETGDSVVTATPSVSSLLPARDTRWRPGGGGVSMESVTFLEMIWRHAAKGMNRGVFDSPADANNSRQAREFHALRQDAYRSGVRLLKKEFQNYAQKEKWEGIELLRMKALTTMLELRRRLRAAERARQLGLSVSGTTSGVAEDKGTVSSVDVVSLTTKSLRKTVSFAHPGHKHRLQEQTTQQGTQTTQQQGEEPQGRRKSVLDVLLAEGGKGSLVPGHHSSSSFHMSVGARGIMTVDELGGDWTEEPEGQSEEDVRRQAIEEEQLLRQAVRRLSTVDNDFDLEHELDQLQRRMELTELWHRQ